MVDPAVCHQMHFPTPRTDVLTESRSGRPTEDEIAEARGLTVRTVQRDWAKARMLLRRALDS